MTDTSPTCESGAATDCVLSTRRQLELMQQLQQLADRRAAAEEAWQDREEREKATLAEQYEAAVAEVKTAHVHKRSQLADDYQRANQEAADQYAEAQQQISQEEKDALEKIDARREQVVAEAVALADHQQFEANSVYDAAKDQPGVAYDAARERIAIRSQQIGGLDRDAHTLLEMRGMLGQAAALEEAAHAMPGDASAETSQEQPNDDPTTANPSAAPTAEQRLERAIAELRHSVLELQDQKIATLFLEGSRPLVWLAPLIGAAAVASLAVWGMRWGWVALGTFGGGTLVWLALMAIMRPRGRRETEAQFCKIVRQRRVARACQEAALESVHQVRTEQEAAIHQSRDTDVRAAAATRDRTVAEIEAWHRAERTRIETSVAEQTVAAATRRDQALDAAQSHYPGLLEASHKEQVAQIAEIDSQFATRRAAEADAREAAWQELADAWRQGFQEIASELAAMQRRSEYYFPDFNQTPVGEWTRPDEPPSAIRFGKCTLPLRVVRHGWPADERLQPPDAELTLPAFWTFDEQPRLAAVASGVLRSQAIAAAQLLALRFLTAMPAGKARLTLIDPVGLGDNFASFSQLADYDEQILGGQIWTTSKQIVEQLARLSETVERILQDYLRNDFVDLRAYNATAGEVAEPYRLVVVANFPAGFTEQTARQLANLAAAGPRCGVYTVVIVDEEQSLPHGFSVDELTQNAVLLKSERGRLVWKYPLFERLPLELDALPGPERLNSLLQQIGQQSHEASRVEVPFEAVAPPAEEIWTHDNAGELAAPIGRAGARQRQALRLGRGTSQHVLIAGKTGSGKSTLLHAMITNLALHYSPDQVEFYLVDFKKGVEFQAYAAGQLPHARVIAIESEREFGVSVLERLDVELRERGERFRQAGVQDLAAMRRAVPQESFPRILLIIDEFQELFVADDKLAQDAALLLDRLVRQGRAFGIHVLLGSQTLAGTYSLPRSTLGQMAVRIALECSEADAHLILSEENGAARLLSRPGEAIYNDQNGRTAGNQPFQVVWLPDAKRQAYLAQLKKLAEQLAGERPAPIVFAGNQPARVEQNEALTQAIEQPGSGNLHPTVWLGSAVRIEPPTSFELRRQGGHNLAIVGSDEEAALGILLTAAGALVVQQSPGAELTCLVGKADEEQGPRRWEALVRALGSAATLNDVASAASAVDDLFQQMQRRLEAADVGRPARYLVVHDLAMFRDLRRREDDFSFSISRDDAAKKPDMDRQFRELLKEGPAVGIHTLLWCDSYNSLSRVIDRATLREIDFRVALPMSVADSTSWIDSPTAGRLGQHRAILYRDDRGTETKFRPYAAPEKAWFERLASQ